jgi:N-dimethylarginine dimethylaminohydrolase
MRTGQLEGLEPPNLMEAGSLPLCSPSVRFGQLNLPVLLMNLPLSLSTRVPNNASMRDRTPREREICLDRAIAQFLELYKHVAKRALVYLLPSTPGLQDQPYVSNLGVVLPHCEADTVLISRFRTAPRVGEDRIGAEFFRLMNFTVKQPPMTFRGEPLYFEGEADLKHIYGNLYVGGHGLRTSRNALTWAAEQFGMEIVPFRTFHPYLYHLDCSLLRLTERAVLMCTSVADPVCIRTLAHHCEIIDVSLEDARAGITNCLLLDGEVLCDSNIAELDKNDSKYPIEKSKIDRLEAICSRFGLSLRVFCMSEFYKSGALLSCLIMHIRQPTKGARRTKMGEIALSGLTPTKLEFRNQS